MKLKATLFVSLALIAITGCSKEVTISVRNHSSIAKNIKLTTPSGTQQIGAVSPGSYITHTTKIKNKLLPASCSCSAGPGATVPFPVTKETDRKIFFHISSKGKMSGPYGENDVYVETEKGSNIRKTIKRTMQVTE